jgi:alpha-ketoglutarate-dependent taurine dioxygenase
MIAVQQERHALGQGRGSGVEAASLDRTGVIPASGDDTIWSNQQAAFEVLNPSLQAFLETLSTVHDSSGPDL